MNPAIRTIEVPVVLTFPNRSKARDVAAAARDVGDAWRALGDALDRFAQAAEDPDAIEVAGLIVEDRSEEASGC